MKSEWQELPLGEVTELVIDYRGKTPKKLGGDWSKTGYRALSAKNIKTGQLVQLETIRFVDEKLYKKWMQDEVHKGDILITSEAPFGQIYFWNSNEKIVLSQRLFCIRLKSEYFSQFFYYYMTTPEFQAQLDGRATGTTVVGLRQPELLKCPVRFPSHGKQQQIAAILSCIDDKIKLNQWINDNLQKQAQAIYTSCFTDTNGCLADICQYSKEKTFVSQLTLDNYYSTENMLSEKGGSVQAASLPMTTQTPRCCPGDVLVSNIRPYFKKIVYCSSEGGCSTDVLCFTPKKNELSAYLFYTLYADKFFDHMVAGSKGTKMPRGDKQQIMTYPIHMPSDVELADYNSIARPILAKIEKNREENLRLTVLRDALLPKLMSGEIDV